MATSPFQISLSLGSFLGLERSRAIQIAADNKLSEIEIVCEEPHLTHSVARRDRTLIQLEMRMYKLKLTAISLNTCFTQPEEAIQSRNHVLDFIELARPYGASLVRITTGPLPSDRATLEQWETLVEYLTPCVHQAVRRGIKLAVETTRDGQADTTQGALMLLDRFDNGSLGLLLNVSDLVLSGEDIESCIAQLAGRVFAVRIQDAATLSDQKNPAWAPLGKGVIPYPTVMRALLAQGWRGSLILSGPYEEQEDQLEQDLAYLRRLSSCYSG